MALRTAERPIRPQDQDAFPDMELEDVLDVHALAVLMHEEGVRYDVLEALTATEIIDFVVALAGVERPGHGSDARVARELIIYRPVLAHYLARQYDPETYSALSSLERPTYTRVLNDYVHSVWLEPHNVYEESLAQAEGAAKYQVRRLRTEAEWRAAHGRDDAYGDD